MNVSVSTSGIGSTARDRALALVQQAMAKRQSSSAPPNASAQYPKPVQGGN